MKPSRHRRFLHRKNKNRMVIVKINRRHRVEHHRRRDELNLQELASQH